MEVIKETLWKRCLSTPTKHPAKNRNICLSETAYQHKGTRKKCKKTNQAAITHWQRQCLMYKPHCKPWPMSKTSDISKQSPSPMHHTFWLGRARFTAQPLSALPLKLHDSLTPCLTECLKCFPSVALVGCCSCLLTGGFCDRLSVLSDLAERHYPVTFARVFFSRRGLFWGEFPLRRTCLLGYCSVY